MKEAITAGSLDVPPQGVKVKQSQQRITKMKNLFLLWSLLLRISDHLRRAESFRRLRGFLRLKT